MSNSAIVSWLSQAEFHLVDPGDAGALPNDDYGIVPLVTTAAQTRTLQQPDHAGLRLVINMITDGGNCVITVAAPGFDVFGSTTMTFSAVGQYVELLAVDRAASTPVWRVVGYDGVAGITSTLATLAVTQATITSLTVGDLVSTGDIGATGSLDISTNAVVDGNTTIGGTLGVTGATTLGVATVGGTLAVTGAATLSGATTIDDNATVTGTLGVTGAATLSSTLGVTGAATFSSTSAHTGNATFAAKLEHSGGGTVTQITSITTGVEINEYSGQITTVSAGTAAAAEDTFTVTNSVVTALSVIEITAGNGTNSAGLPIVVARNPGAGTFDITIANLHASDALNGTLVINFAVKFVTTS